MDYLSDHVHLNEAEDAVVILDQSRLPNVVSYLTLRSEQELYTAIAMLQVRGAPCIGIFAGYGLYVLAQQFDGWEMGAFRAYLNEKAAYLNASRPTAVNLSWALQRMLSSISSAASVAEGLSMLRKTCMAIHREDIQMCRSIAEYGLSLLSDGAGILTHCNAGPLATSRYGTALGPILLGKEKGYSFHVFADETRPLLQGARLTTYELAQNGVPVTLICDNMASIVMKNGWIDACFVGCDRIAANGDTANKIGTSGVAILAKHYGIPFYVLGPSSSIDLSCPDGESIPIELRNPEEIKQFYFAEPSALPEIACYNPAFDVTDHRLITAIVTEYGICRPPFSDSLRRKIAPKG